MTQGNLSAQTCLLDYLVEFDTAVIWEGKGKSFAALAPRPFTRQLLA